MASEYLLYEPLKRVDVKSCASNSSANAARYILRLGPFAEAGDRVLASDEGNLPPWAEDSIAYFKTADEHMLRENGNLAHRITAVLPKELGRDDHEQIIRGFVTDVLGEENVPFVWAYHEGAEGHHDQESTGMWTHVDGEDNPHVHILIGTAVNDGVSRPSWQWFKRANGAEPSRGGAPKTSLFESKSLPRRLRGAWRDQVNERLEAAGLDIRIDMRSYAHRGVEIRPTVHVGRPQARTAIDGRGAVHARRDTNRTIYDDNAQLIEDRPEVLLQLHAHQPTISDDQIEHDLQHRCVRDPEQAQRVREALDARLTPVGSDARGVMRRATREQLCRAPELAIQSLTLTQSTFTEHELADLFGDDAMGRKALAEARRHPVLVSVGTHDVRGSGPVDADDKAPPPIRQQRFTSAELLAAERRLQETATALHGTRGPQLSKEAVRSAAAEATLDRTPQGPKTDGEQHRMLRELAGRGGSNSGLVLIQGRPGTGKSHVVRALRNAAQRTGVRVVGAAIAGKAAQDLARGAGVETHTVAQLTWRLERGKTDLQGAILVVDEAGMADARSLDRLLAAAKAGGVGRVALIGDTQQLAPVGPSNPFRELQDKYGATDLREIRRQRAPHQREAVKRMSRGSVEDIKAGLEALAGHFHEHDNRDRAHAQLIRSWAEARLQQPGNSQLILAYRNEDVDTLNHLARRQMRAAGVLGADQHIVDQDGQTHTLATQDQFVFTQRDDQIDVRNGTTARVIDLRGDSLTLRLDTGRDVTVSARQYAPILQRGFATTVHRAQGATVDRTYVYATRSFAGGGRGAFVALSRHRDDVEVHYDREEFKPRPRYDRGLVDPDHPRTPRDELMDAWSRRHDEQSATEALREGQHGTTDTAAHVRRWRAAFEHDRQTRVERQLQAIVREQMTVADAASDHVAVRVARMRHTEAFERLQKARGALFVGARKPPRTLRFAAQHRYFARMRALEDAVRQATAAEQQATAGLISALQHPDVRAHASRALAQHERRVGSAREALVEIEQLRQRQDARQLMEDFAVAKNVQAGEQRYRVADARDRGTDLHHEFLRIVKLQHAEIAELRSPDGTHLVHLVNGHKSAQDLTPGERVGFRQNGPFLERRNRVWAEKVIAEDVRRGDGQDVAALSSEDASILFKVTHMEQPHPRVRYARLRGPDGQKRVVDLTYHPQPWLFGRGAEVRVARNRTDERPETRDQAARTSSPESPLVPEAPAREVAAEDDPKQPPHPTRPTAARSAEGVAHQQDGPQAGTKDADTASATADGPNRQDRVRLEVIRPHLSQQADLLQLEAAVKDAEQRLLTLMEGRPVPRRDVLVMAHPRVKQAYEHWRAALDDADRARSSTPQGAQAPDKTLPVQDLERVAQRAEAALARTKSATDVKEWTRLQHDAAVKALGVDARELDRALWGAQSARQQWALRTVAVDHTENGLRVQLIGHEDRARKFIFDKRVDAQGRHIAVLRAEDGTARVLDVTGHAVPAELRSGQLVMLSKDGRSLQTPWAKRIEKSQQRLKTLDERLSQPPPRLSDSAGQVPELRAYALKLRQAEDHQAQLRAAPTTASAAHQADTHRRTARSLLEKQPKFGPFKERFDQWTEAYRSHTKSVRAERDRLDRAALRPHQQAAEIRVLHELNAAKERGVPTVQRLTSQHEGFQFEQAIERQGATIAVLRHGDGRRVTHARLDGRLAQIAEPGMGMHLERSKGGATYLVPTKAADRARLHPRSRTTDLQQDRAR